MMQHIEFLKFYLNINRAFIIHYENILKLYLIYHKIYLEYIQNMLLFHSKFKNTFLFQMFLKIYKK
jgi:hypothetical protein